ncbi:hypothetical protein B566_EDAN004486 [Ephemera danica]|nr:hypothetical protein B566_EDAN004486 [Ephemera danica]
MSSIMKPLFDLKSRTDFVWTKQCTKNALLGNQILVPFDPSKLIVLTCDSSSYGVGAFLSVLVDKTEGPVMFASTTLTPAKKNYAQIERESSAIIFGVTKEFTLVTDHLPLKAIFNPEKGVVNYIKVGWPIHCPDPSLQYFFLKRSELTLNQECIIYTKNITANNFIYATQWATRKNLIVGGLTLINTLKVKFQSVNHVSSLKKCHPQEKCLHGLFALNIRGESTRTSCT